jgi:tetratricopeptide (TPR) repeat protein
MKPIGIPKIELLEKELQHRPESLSVLEKLLWEYYQDPALHTHPNRIDHILRYIKRFPYTTTAKSPIVQIDPNTSQEGYQLVEFQWLNLLGKKPGDAEIARAAANFYSSSEPTKALEILQNMIAEDPSQADLWMDLGLYSTNAVERLNSFKEARQRGAKQPNLLVWISRFAVEAKDFTTAEAAAIELLALVDAARSKCGDKLDWTQRGKELWSKALAETGDKTAASNLVNEISAHSYHKHWGHTALGHVAMNNNNIASAIEHLKKSCEVVSDHRLSSYGPSFTLAEELCSSGAWPEVAKYLSTCKKFWENECLDIWLEQVERKEIPTFKRTQ